MAQPSITLGFRVRWVWLYAVLYIIGLPNLAFRVCVKFDQESPK